VRFEENTEVAPGTVLRQQPAAGTKLESGAAVEIFVARRPRVVPTTRVPDVVGQEAQEAARILRAAGYLVRIRGGLTGKVVSQAPEGGTAVKTRTWVTLTLR
jgi:serine/threonine-protein kinase